MNKWKYVVLVFAFIIIGIFSYSLYLNYNKNLSCISIGQASSNPSMGPNGYFGKCCPGLVATSKAENANKDGGALYCQPIIPLPWLDY